MEARRGPRTVIGPKVRQVGFFAPTAPQPPRPDADATESVSPPLLGSPVSNSLSPVMIPPPRHVSERTAAVPVPETGFRRQASGDHVPIGSYNPSVSLLGTSPAKFSEDGEFSEDSSTAGWFRRSNSGKLASSFPGGGFDLSPGKPPEKSVGNKLSLGVEVEKPVVGSGNDL